MAWEFDNSSAEHDGRAGVTVVEKYHERKTILPISMLIYLVSTQPSCLPTKTLAREGLAEDLSHGSSLRLAI
jgi:hypothetical protein